MSPGLKTVGTVIYHFGYFVVQMVAFLGVFAATLKLVLRYPLLGSIVGWALGSLVLIMLFVLFLLHVCDVYDTHRRNSKKIV